MKKVNVLQHQNILDIAVEQQGDIRSVVDIALNNGVSITDALFPNLTLSILDTEYKNIDIADYFKRRDQQIATNGVSGFDLYVFNQVLPIIL